MLKHVSQSCNDVSSRRSLRHNSFSLDSRLGASAEFLDELVAADNKSVHSSSSSGSHSSRSSSHHPAASAADREYRSFCLTKTGHYSGLVTLPRQNRNLAVAAASNSYNSQLSGVTSAASAKHLSESCHSLPNFSNITAIKVYAQCLRPHLSYKTVIITRHTTSRQVVLGLLSRFRMKHRDPKLFYLTMEVNIGNAGAATRTIALEDSSCLADLIACNPWGACRFRLQARQGGLIKVYDGEVRADSVYKSIIISHDSSVLDTLDILESCYNLPNNVALRLYEVDLESGDTRLLDNSEKPLDVKDDWSKLSRKIFRLEKTNDGKKRHLKAGLDILEANDSGIDVSNGKNPPAELFTRSTLVRNTYLRQSVRKKQFLKSMINDPHLLRISSSNNSIMTNIELNDSTAQSTKSFSLSRFNLSGQIIREDSVEDSGGEESCSSNPSANTSTSSDNDELGGVGDETRSEGDLNCSTSGVSSLSCSSLDSLHGHDNSFYT